MFASVDCEKKGNVYNLSLHGTTMSESMECVMEGSPCGRYIYNVILENGVEIDRYIVEDRMETNY